MSRGPRIAKHSALTRFSIGLGVLSMSTVGLTHLSGCGYQMGAGVDGSPSLYRSDVSTVAVPILANKSFYRGIEMQLTRALVTQLESRTPYRVASRERADTILEATITDIRVSTVSSDVNTSLPQEQLFTVTLDLTWKDLRSGLILVERTNFEQSSTYYPTLGEGRFVGSQAAVEAIAAAIVQQLQKDW